MKTLKIVLVLLVSVLVGVGCEQDKSRTKAEKQGWLLSMQSFTFHLFTVTESLNKTQELGIRFIEIFPGQKMGGDFGDIVFGYDLNREDQKKLVNLATSKDIKIISSGVWTAQREEWHHIFSFAKNMGMDPIASMRQLDGKIIALHFKDIAPQGEEQSLEDMIWGKGILNVKGMMEELKRQNFRGYFTIEYEADWENNLPQIRKSIDYFSQTTDNIL